jgi:hypothetical protein
LERFSRWQRSHAEIAQQHHLSYPSIMQWESVWYCVPESARTEGVDLYAWNASMGSWQLRRRLLDGVAIVDATLFRHNCPHGLHTFALYGSQIVIDGKRVGSSALLPVMKSARKLVWLPT